MYIDDRGSSICKIMAEIAAYMNDATTRFRAHRFTCKTRDSGIKREIISAIARSIDFAGPMENLSSSSIPILSISTTETENKHTKLNADVGNYAEVNRRSCVLQTAGKIVILHSNMFPSE